MTHMKWLLRFTGTKKARRCEPKIQTKTIITMMKTIALKSSEWLFWQYNATTARHC